MSASSESPTNSPTSPSGKFVVHFDNSAKRFSDECIFNSRCQKCDNKVTKTEMYAYHTQLGEIDCIYHITCLVLKLFEQNPRCGKCSFKLTHASSRYFISRKFFFQSFFSVIPFSKILKVEPRFDPSKIPGLSEVYAEALQCFDKLPPSSYSSVSELDTSSLQSLICCGNQCTEQVKASDMHAYHLDDRKEPQQRCIYHINCLAMAILVADNEFDAECPTCQGTLNTDTIRFFISEKFFFNAFFKDIRLLQMSKKESMNTKDGRRDRSNTLSDATRAVVQRCATSPTSSIPERVEDSDKAEKTRQVIYDAHQHINLSKSSVKVYNFKELSELPEALNKLITDHPEKIFCQNCNALLVKADGFAYHKSDEKFCCYHVDCVKTQLDSHETFSCVGCTTNCSEEDITVYIPQDGSE